MGGGGTYRASTASEGDVVKEVTVRHRVAALFKAPGGGGPEVREKEGEKERETDFYTVEGESEGCVVRTLGSGATRGGRSDPRISKGVHCIPRHSFLLFSHISTDSSSLIFQSTYKCDE